jgi:hypothetical protein
MDVNIYYPNQDPNIIYLYEIIGCYFTDIIFNHIYINAKIRINTTNASLVDEYIKRLQLYVIGIKNDHKCYENTLSELYKYYCTITNDNIPILSFIDKIIYTCIPDNFIKQLSQLHKSEIICNIISDLISNMVSFVISPDIINDITINHKLNAVKIIKKLQDYAIQILINKKINILNKFLKTNTNIESNNDTSMKIISDLKGVIIKLNTDNKKLVSDNNILTNEINKLNLHINELNNKESKLRKLIELIQKDNQIKSLQLDNMYIINKYKKEELESNDKEELESNDKEELESNDKEELESNNREELESNDKEELESNNREELESNNKRFFKSIDLYDTDEDIISD